MAWTTRFGAKRYETRDEEANRWQCLKAIQKWLSTRRWDVFWTQTFRRPVSAPGAMALFSSCLAEASLKHCVTAACYVLESREGRHWHVHALATVSGWTSLLAAQTGMRESKANSSGKSRPSSATFVSSLKERYCKAWKEEYARRLGWARIFPVNNSSRILAWYLTKYLTKEGATDNVFLWTRDEKWGMFPWCSQYRLPQLQEV